MINAQINKYLETNVQTASSEQLLIMLYDGAIRFCKMGIDGINKKNYEQANTYLGKAQSILFELMASLDRSASISEGLLKLYDYFVYRLAEANIHKNIEPATEVLNYLIELKETWQQAAAALNDTELGAKYG